MVSVAGNQGTEGVFMQNSPASGSHVVSVASVDNTFHFTKVMLVQELPDKTFRKLMEVHRVLLIY